ERPQPPPFEEEWLARSLNRYLTWGLVFMVLLLAGFAAYRLREPSLRHDATRQQQVRYQGLGATLFSANCAQCHGKEATGGSAPTLNSQQFLKSTTDEQMRVLISGGVSGSAMPAWSLDFGGTLTDEQVRQLVTFLRSLEPNAPSVPNWRSGAKAG
ncbi:MAG TPA: c-type cytochrome, partial [Acidimicrobiia bacterium]|nr:c-type cytochrome [Acidimicrobiia bacterium]